MSQAFTVYLRVRYAECDAQKVVFNARYADYVDVVITEYMRVLMGGYSVLFAHGVDNQLVRMLIEWRASARFDDILAVEVETLKVGNTSFTLQFLFKRYPDGVLLSTVETVYVLVDTNNYQKTPIPDWLREKMLAGAPGQSINFSGENIDH